MKKKTPNIRWFISFSTVLLLFRCATIPGPPPPEPLDDQTVAAVIGHIREQEKRVNTFYSLGKLTATKGFFESETNILIVGSKDPYRMKVEVTHPWGAPLYHILILGTRLHVLSFKEKKYYIGPLTAETLSRFLPWVFEQDLIWSTLRGLPAVRNYVGHASPGSDRIILLDKQGRVIEEIDLIQGKLVPERIYFPNEGLTLTFSDYHDKGGISYAREVTVQYDREKHRIGLENGKMVFNASLSDELFRFEVPRAFTRYHFQDGQEGLGATK